MWHFWRILRSKIFKFFANEMTRNKWLRDIDTHRDTKQNQFPTICDQSGTMSQNKFSFCYTLSISKHGMLWNRLLLWQNKKIAKQIFVFVFWCKYKHTALADRSSFTTVGFSIIFAYRNSFIGFQKMLCRIDIRFTVSRKRLLVVGTFLTKRWLFDTLALL